MEAKIYARIQKNSKFNPDHRSFHNPLAWQGGCDWQPLDGMAAFELNDDIDYILFSLVQEDVISLAEGETLRNLLLDGEKWEQFSTTVAIQNGFYVFFFVGEKLSRLPDGVVVRPLQKEEIPQKMRKKIEEYLEIRDNGLLAVYEPDTYFEF